MSLIKSVNSASAADASINCSATGILQNRSERECTKGESCFSFDQHPPQHRAFKGKEKAPCLMAGKDAQPVSKLDKVPESCRKLLDPFL